MGVLAAVLTWEVEHVGSMVLAVAIAAGGVTIGVIVSRHLRDDMERLADHYEALLETADRSSQQAEAAGRLKDEFLATLSHELRTPLNSILGWARLLGTKQLSGGQSDHAIHAIERAGWAQSRLIEDLLDMSRIVSGKLQLAPAATMIQPVIERAVDALRPAADAKNLTLTTAFDASLGSMVVDPDRLQQVVWNLVSNAIKFTPAGGRVDINVAARAGEMRLVVRDTGIGFGSDIAAHLFERFRQGDSSSTRQHGGLGLGLGIVRHVVELHGGTVFASSDGEGLGCVFEVRLPIRPVRPAAVEAPPVTAHLPSLDGLSVLLVDNDSQSLDLARTALEGSGASVVTATSVQEARDSLSRQTPDVLVSDVMMPHEDGYELIREVREIDARLGRHTPAVALTALARSNDRRQSLDAGYQMHIAKPIDPTELAITIDRLAHPVAAPRKAS
jgi:signal transduction histidine kinase/CheY-like chemotaxis protein